MSLESGEDLAALVPPMWREALAPTIQSESFAELSRFVASERAAHEVFPPAQSTFSALATAPEATRVVVLGQDPYHGPGQAHGLAFSVQRGVPIPPSLRNIFKERVSDTGLEAPEHGCLSAWAEQGVLLLNTVLTVRRGEANSHRKRGWERFTDAVIDHLAATGPRVFVLWGKPAQRKAKRIGEGHIILQAPHPSPLSAHRGFFGSAPFSKVNRGLDQLGLPPIDWRLPA